MSLLFTAKSELSLESSLRYQEWLSLKDGAGAMRIKD